MNCPNPKCRKYHKERYFVFVNDPETLMEVKYCDECGAKLDWDGVYQK